jgi:hypothetical protein
MPTYSIQASQSFSVTYEIEADGPDDAWDLFITTGLARCVDQQPGEILSVKDESSIEEIY